MKILIATDGSEFSRCAVERAAAMGSAMGDACFRVVSVYEPQVPMAAEPFALSAQHFDELDRIARKRAEDAAAEAAQIIKDRFGERTPCIESLVELGTPPHVIVETAKDWGADLIIVGSHGLGFWGRLAIGSVSDAVVHHAPCSVLVVKAPNDQPAG